jgi:hypothetical protein
MPSTLYGPLDLVKNELRNAAVQNLGTAPASPIKGQLYYDTTSDTVLFWDGAAWQPTKTIAGNGLTKTGATIDLVGGTGLTVAADLVSVDTSVIATVASLASFSKKFATTLTGTASPEVITHNLNTRDIQLRVLNGASPYTAVEVDWDATTVNTATVRYTPNLGAGYRVVVVG